MSQSEVERLLAQVAEQENKTTVHQADGSKTAQAVDSIQPYDFRNPVFLSANELRKLRIEHEEYIRALAARLSIYLRMEFTLQMSRLETLTFQKFKEGLASPTHLTLFKSEPLRGVCILDVSPRLGLTMVDRLMGGPGHSVALNRDLSEIEIALLDQIIHIVLGEWCNHWSSIQEVRHQVMGHDNNGQFLQTTQPDAVMLVLSMEARIADCLEQIQIGFPYSTVEPLIEKLSKQLRPDDEDRSKPKERRWNTELVDVNIPITAEWPPVTVKASDLANLKVGDFLPIPIEYTKQVQIKLARLKKFAGRLGTKGNNWAVEVQQILPT
ncbi:MAG TPA: flagellar motor switch protein FliM [Verrucomicrobiae bacterium]